MSTQESQDTDEESWGELKCITDSTVPVTKLKKSKIVIGRAKNCDINLSSRLVSGHHCYLAREDDGAVWIHDTSSNGTFINKTTHLKNGARYLLSSGDELYLVLKQNKPDANVTLLFTNLCKADESLLDSTQEYDLNLNNSEPEENEPACKRQKCNSPLPPNLPDVKSSTLPEEKSRSTNESVEGDKTNKNTDAMEESLLCSICQEILYDCITLQPCMHCFCAGCYSQWMKQSNDCPQCRAKVLRISKNHIVNNLIEAFLKLHPEKRRSDSEIAELVAKNSITNEMLYSKKDQDNSNFFEMEEDSSESGNSDSDNCETNCSCCNSRTSSFITGSHFSNSVFNAHPSMNPLRAQPSRCRQCPSSFPPNQSQNSNENIKSKSRVVLTVIQDPRTEAATVTNVERIIVNDGASTSSASSGPAFVPCPSNSETAVTTTTTSTTAAATSAATPTSATLTSAGTTSSSENVPVYTCTRFQSHAMCRCCLELMPDRRSEQYVNASLPPQNCSRCYRLFCHMYWGCRKLGCLGCLNTFQNMNFGGGCLSMIVNENAYESEILRNYLTAAGKTWQDLLQTCIERLESNQYSCLPPVNSSSVLCYPCALTTFRQLAYQFRKDIPRDQLPREVISRSDCYWGRNCRTQKNKLHHAQRFNHICEQIRFQP